MRGKLQPLLLAVALVGLAACATVSEDEWTGTPPDEPPEALNDWDVVWDDQRGVWRMHGSGERVGRSDVPADRWEYEQNAIGMRVRASDQLNFARGSAHTIALHVFQARDPGDLRRQLEHPGDVYRLLRRGDDDPDVLAMDRFIVEPGRSRLVRVDRADESRYLVIVAGYTEYSRNAATRIIEIPEIYDIPRGRERFAFDNIVDTFNPFSSTPDPRPGRLEGWMMLDETGIERLRMLAR